ncbi:integrase [Sphingomonas sp. Leaf17]|uniref:tyrosine-type recombinase/integrase n=1 Tax=Sphingomonas sp. Leaf17 TaxID=1735683 RepID=UPI0006FD1DD3|nr:integrase arm-type DNA-binding domain-containing protein [Sphingomonas sp. Leaf17]KQM65818.1 integrase [Sphingomonas sp. Leaf17]
MPLTVVEIRNARPGEKPQKLADGKGLYLFVTTKGAKSWRMKYRHADKEKVLTFGQYPEVSLAEARDRRDAARAVLRSGKDPAVEADRERRAAIAAIGATFRTSALAWHEDERPRWSPRHAQVVLNALERDVFPDLGKLPVADIDGPLILKALRKIEKRGSIETAKRVLGYLSAIFIRAKGEHLVSVNPTLDLIDALKPTPKGAKQPALTTLPELLALQQVVDRSTSNPTTKLASRLLAMTAVRVGVLRTAEWDEISGIDWTDAHSPAPAALWRISAERMKLEVEDKGDEAFDHDVPLPDQAVRALRALHRLTGRGRLIFPGGLAARVPMSDAAISTLYKRMAGGRYKGRHVPHGWRSAFSTIMNEWAMEHGREGDRLLIDLMLAHRPKGVSGSEFAYMRAKFAARRRTLAETWAAMITEGLDDPHDLLRDQAAR